MARIDQDRMMLLALAVVADAHWAAQSGPVVRTNALRLALTYLHSRSNGDRSSYDVFWMECAALHEKAGHDARANAIRSSRMCPAWHGILRSLGLAHSIEFDARLSKVRDRERQAIEALHGRQQPRI